ncbi:chemotaxis protein CheX [Acidithrix ferrooxidans]|uniref:Chemotaxis phosphatase CheX-like domain-containing protein n=1 Tax=Acidithrix ferrooxidans TaxID=1280514 RepID=A0A0D8HJ25_9ACTN|nr:chemotaxis protein CheX [Acidithrix ferrooxidans]KJF17950.1 hypothetical protein AXFE_12350 [Acidithrix ferrooxidans]
MDDPTLVSTWLHAMVNSAEELATSTLGLEGITVINEALPKERDFPGSYVAIVGDSYNFEYGIAGSWDSCAVLARALLFMEPEEELSEDDLADAVNEVINIVAGGIKRRMSEIDTGLKLGLPAFFNGTLHPTSHQEAAASKVDLAGAEVYLMVFRHRT